MRFWMTELFVLVGWFFLGEDGAFGANLDLEGGDVEATDGGSGIPPIKN
jgi:hypothetical protein